MNSSSMTMDDTKALTLLQRKFFEYTKDNCKKARGRDYICDHEIHYAFDYRHPNDRNFIGITCRFLYNNDINTIVGFEVYELFKGENFVEGISKIGDGIEVGLVHKVAFCGNYRTVKRNNIFDIEKTEYYSKYINADKVQSYVEVP